MTTGKRIKVDIDGTDGSHANDVMMTPAEVARLLEKASVHFVTIYLYEGVPELKVAQ